MLNLNQNLIQKAKETIFVVGAARSGTSYIGKILGSFLNAEYFHEPTGLLALIANHEYIESKVFEQLIYTYLIEDLLISAICGRSINTNLKDSSSIYSFKGINEINSRLHHSYTRKESLKLINKKKLVVKLIINNFLIGKICNKYFDSKLMVIIRHPNDVINSLVRKKWFNENNDISYMGELVKSYNNKSVPYFLNETELKQWDFMDEINRCAFYYYKQYENIKDIGNISIFKYEDLIEKPNSFAERLAQETNSSFGAKTKKLINNHFPNFRNNENLLKKVNRDLLSKIESLNFYSV